MYHPTNPIPDFDEDEEENRCRVDGQEILLSLIVCLIGFDPKLKYALH